jgi:hypothetical protein
MSKHPMSRRARTIIALACTAPLLAHAGQVAGSVHDAAGHPVAGALVVAASETEAKTADGKPRRWITTSDTAGRFAFDDLPTGMCHVSASAGDRVGLATTPCQLDTRGSTATADVIVTHQPEHVSGHVQRPAGARADSDDFVLLARYPAGESENVTVMLGTRVVGSAWSLDLPAGTWMVKAITAAGESRTGQFVVPGQSLPVELRFANGSIRYPAMARELHAMVDKDQEVRNKAIAARDESPHGWAPVQRVDRANLAHLKEMIHQHGWPTAADIGDDGMGDIWLLAQHAQQDFIAQALPHLKAAADRGEISRSTLALMIDRDLVNRHQPQIYGSQGEVKNGHFVLFDVQDEAHLDARRAQVGLGPISDYKALIEKDYREPAATH